MKHIDAEQLILYYYGERNETDDRTVIETHLGVCHRCRDEYDALAQTLAAVSSLPIPDRAATYGQDVWQRLAPRLKHSGADALPASSGLKDTGWNIVLQKKPQPARWLEVFTWQRWVLGGALAAMLVASFLVGRFWPRPERPALNAANTTNAGPIPAHARDRVLLAAVADHMERSEILLRELENADEGGGRRIDISVQREQAQELAAGSRLY